MPAERVAVVSGANRGIGFAVAQALADRRFVVVLGSRDQAKGEEAAARIESDVRPRPLDVSDQQSIDDLASWVEQELGHVDVLVNNAGILVHDRASDAERETVRTTLETNVVGAWMLANALVPLLRRGTSQRIVNVSSGAGSLASMASYAPVYSVSKAALNAVTRVLAADLRSDGILVNSVCPGWVRSDMGGAGATRSLEEGAASVLWAALLPDDGPTGGFFRDGETVPW